MSTCEPTGDPFPQFEHRPNGYYTTISFPADLRDYFAAQAINGMYSNRGIVDTLNYHALMAKEAYLLADTMIAARTKSNA